MTEELNFKSQIPQLDLSEGTEMLIDFSREGQRYLISARNSLLVLDTVSTDMEAVESVFKMLHTISGLADFLNLHDIYWITKLAAEMVNFVRKKKCKFEGIVHELTREVLERLQKLFELLDEQVSKHGKLESDYLEQESLVVKLNDFVNKIDTIKKAPLKSLYVDRATPTISTDKDYDFYDQLKRKIHNTQGNIVIRKEPLERLLDDFKRMSTELKKAQSKVQDRQKELIQERELAISLTQKAQDDARTKSDYLANMSHEIRTLINAILGFSDLVKGDLPKDSKHIDHLNTIILTGKMLLEIVNNILDFSKVEAGKLSLEEIPFNLRGVIENVFQIIRSRLDSKPINLYLDIDETVPLSLIGDPTRLKQIFMNLLDNAVKFTEKGEIGISVRLGRQQGKLNHPVLHFSVIDSGIGISEDRKNFIFDSFTQADASTTRLYGGSGLGLALCRAFVEAMKGSIWVDSEFGAGTDFNFVIQFKKADEDLLLEVPEFTGTEKVLVITPFEKTSKMFQDVFDHLSLTPLSICRNVKHASEVLSSFNRPPDIIFVDVLYDGGEGEAFVKSIKDQKQFQQSKIVAITSDIKYADKDEQSLKLFDGVIFSPIILQEFILLVHGLFPDDDNADVKTVKVIEEVSEEDFSDVKILVVEDSIPNQELLRVYFEDLGCYCDYASNGKEAIECLQRMTYDLCFMDLQMPVMGGLEATQLIRNELKLTVPIIAFTAAEVQEEREKCIEIGMSDYLSKPFDVEQLKEKIKKFRKIKEENEE